MNEAGCIIPCDRLSMLDIIEDNEYGVSFIEDNEREISFMEDDISMTVYYCGECKHFDGKGVSGKCNLYK